MAKKHDKQNSVTTDDSYKAELRLLQIELVKLQKHIIKKNKRVLIIFEGRDAGGKDGTIKRITQYLSPRETRIVALGKPSDRDNNSWYFQRYVPYLPASDEIVFFNRSWYNRAGVEKVMGFCSNEEYHEFLESVPDFEQMLIKSGIVLFKYYLDISKDEQKARLKDRQQNPLKQWKVSPIDKVAQKHWDDYSKARNVMFNRTHHPNSPWTLVRADDKKSARINIIKDLLYRFDFKDKNQTLCLPDSHVVFAYDETYLHNGMIAP